MAIAREIVDHIDLLLRKHEKHALRAPDNFLSQWVGSCIFPPPFANNLGVQTQVNTCQGDAPVGFYHSLRVARYLAAAYSVVLPVHTAPKEEVELWQDSLPSGTKELGPEDLGRLARGSVRRQKEAGPISAVVSTRPFAMEPSAAIGRLKRQRPPNSWPLASLR